MRAALLTASARPHRGRRSRRTEPPQSWDEWLAWAEGATIREDTLRQLGFYSSSFAFNRVDLFTRLAEGNGGSMFAADGMTPTMNSPEAVEAAAFFQRLSECCDQRGAIEADNIGLGQGRTAMVYNNFAFRNWQNEFPDLLQYAGMGLVPAGPSGSPEMTGVGLGVNVIGITSTARNPEVRSCGTRPCCSSTSRSAISMLACASSCAWN
jgi:multiple sugar transport system substrate-binding protein